MSCRSSWGLVQRLSLQSLSKNQCSTRVRSIHSVTWINTTSPLRSPALSKSLHHATPAVPFSRYGSLLDKPWQRISTTSGRKNLICLQSYMFSTSTGSDKDPTPLDTKDKDSSKLDGIKKTLLHENIYTIPNFLTFTRLVAAPVIGYWVLQGDYKSAAILFGVASVTDGLDGWIARRFNMQSIVGTILDPMADKTLMTILTVTLAMQNLIPVPIATVILGRDAGLILASFYYRYISLPEPKTFARYWDFSIPSAEVHPTTISKVNTVIQMAYICLSLLSPVLDFPYPEHLGYLCAVTTIWSGASYVYSKDAVKILYPPKK